MLLDGAIDAGAIAGNEQLLGLIVGDGELFFELGVGGFPVHCTAAHDAPISERYHSARSTTALANSPAAGYLSTRNGLSRHPSG